MGRSEDENLRSSIDVTDISGDTGSTSNIVEGEPGDEGVELHEKGEGLTNPAGGSEDGHFAIGGGFSPIATAEEMGAEGGRTGERRSD